MTPYQLEYVRSLHEPEAFWREQAEQIQWYRRPDQILSVDENNVRRWFLGGKLNTSYLALDAHLDAGHGDRAALIYDSPVTDTHETISYRQLHEQVARFAGVLRKLGVEKGDTVIIYMPMIPQTVVAMLACARLGAVHSVVFGGFAPHELVVRIEDAQPKVLLTASAGKEIDRVIDYIDIVNEALQTSTHKVNACVVYQRDFHKTPLQTEGQFDWEQLEAAATPVDAVEVDAGDPLYILYTSGTTGTPKGVVRDHGGHAVAMKYSMSNIYDVQPGEVFWAASDVGWVVGHSYIVYAPLIHGCTTVLYEGKPVRTPDAGAFWRVVQDHNVRALFTAPTAIRAIRQADSAGYFHKKYNTSSLRYLFLAGERCDAATLNWAKQLLQIPVIDHWWQTESGWPMVANMPGLEMLQTPPGSAGKPVCGYDIRILNSQGQVLPPDQEGSVAVRLPLPPGCLPNLWNNTTRFRKAYLEQFPCYYVSGDGRYKDGQGYVYITGRLDDVINVAGHRLSTAEIEEVVAAHPDVAECAVIGTADKLKGEIPVGFVVLKSGAGIEAGKLRDELIQMVRQQVGGIASFKQIYLTNALPKTRSGKILRRIMRSMVQGDQFQPPSTIENPGVLEEIAEVIGRESNKLPAEPR
ncbi:MAG: acetate--CoA ligase [Bythopirellula sp.]